MTKKILGVFLGLACAGFASAQSRPPVAPPLSLPPLPGHIPTDRYLPPLPDYTEPRDTKTIETKTPETTAETNPTETYSKEKMLAALVLEANRMQEALQGRMGFWFNVQDSEGFKKVKTEGKFADKWTIKDNHFGFLVYFQQPNPMNTLSPPTCMVAFDQSKGSSFYDNFVEPTKKISNPSTSYAFAIAHAAAHCIDYEERQIVLNKKLAWKATETSQAGLLPEEAKKAYGVQFSKDAYWGNPERVMTQNQIAYEERGADAFAAGWALKVGASKDGVRAISQSLATTKVAIEYIQNEERDVARARGVDSLWDLARTSQRTTWNGRTTGDVRLDDTNVKSNIPVRYIVTSQGLVGVDENGNPVATENTDQPKNARNFNNIPRFGSSRRF